MELGPILTPIHQGHQQLIRSAQLGRSAKVPQAPLQDRHHLIEHAPAHAGQAFEIAIFECFDVLVSHAPIMAHSILLQEV